MVDGKVWRVMIRGMRVILDDDMKKMLRDDHVPVSYHGWCFMCFLSVTVFVEGFMYFLITLE